MTYTEEDRTLVSDGGEEADIEAQVLNGAINELDSGDGAPVIEETEKTREEILFDELAGILNHEGLTVEEVDALFERIGFGRGTEVSVETIADSIREGNGGNGMRSIETDMTEILNALKSIPEGTEEEIHALSIGGTHVKAGKVKVKVDRSLDVQSFYECELKDGETIKTCATATEFWKHVLPAEFIQEITNDINAGKPINIALTCGWPIQMTSETDGYSLHFSDKIQCDELAPLNSNGREQNPGQKVSMAQSFCDFMRSAYGLTIEKDCVAISPNDTVSSALAYGKDGAFILGTGTNGATLSNGKATNLEAGRFTFEGSQIDKNVCQKNKKSVEFETLAAGAVMGDAFIYAIKHFFGEEHDLHKKLLSLAEPKKLNDTVTWLIFSFVYGGKEPSNTFNDQEKAILKLIATQFTERSADYCARILAGTEEVTKTKFTFVAEGSLITENSRHVARINEIYKELSGNDREILVAEQLKVSGENANKVDGSLAGTAVLGFANALIKAREKK